MNGKSSEQGKILAKVNTDTGIIKSFALWSVVFVIGIQAIQHSIDEQRYLLLLCEVLNSSSSVCTFTNKTRK